MSFSGQAAKAPPARSSVNSMALQTLTGVLFRAKSVCPGAVAYGPHLSPGLGDSHPLSSEALLFCAPVAVSSPTAFFFFSFCVKEKVLLLSNLWSSKFSVSLSLSRIILPAQRLDVSSVFLRKQNPFFGCARSSFCTGPGFLLSLKACGIFSCSMRDRMVPDQGRTPGPLCWERSLSQWPPGSLRARSLDNGFLSWDTYTAKGWVDSRGHRGGVQTHGPRACGLGQTDRGRGACHRAGVCVRNLLVPPTDTGDPGFPKYQQAKHA